MSPWRKTFYATWLGQVCSITGFSCVFPLLPFYIRELGITGDGNVALWTGRSAAASGLAMAICAPLWGMMADRYGRKMMVLRSMFGGALILALLALARNITDLMILRTLQGVLTGTITASLSLVAGVTPPKRSGFTLGMMQAAVFIGAAVGPFIGGELAERLGLRPVFYVGAGILVFGGLLVKFFTYEEFVASPRTEPRLKSFTAMFAVAGFAAALFTLFLVNFGNTAFQPVFPLFVEKLHGATEGAKALTGRVLAAAGFAAAFSAGFLGRLGDRWGYKRLLVTSTLVAGIVTLPLAFAHSVPQLFLLRIMFGFAAAGIMPSANAIIRHISDEKHLGKAYGITASVSCLGWGLGPLAGGWVADQMGLTAPFVVTGVVLLLTSAIVGWRIR